MEVGNCLDLLEAESAPSRKAGCHCLTGHWETAKYLAMKTTPVELPAELVWSDPQRLGGRLCFRNTRVPVDALFENLEDGVSLAEFLDAFEGVTREQAVGVLEAARAAIAEPSPA